MSWRQSFDADPGYLNTASLGVPPRVAVDAMDVVLAGWRRGRLEPPDFDNHVTRARTAWAALTGVDVGRVAVGATVSGLVGLVAASLADGAQVLSAESDFTSVTFPFLAQNRRGVAVREVPLDRIVDEINTATDLVAVSAVQSADGRVLDVGALVAAAAAHGAQVLLDTTQSCGWLPLDCSGVDYVVCAAYKWLLSPRGVAFLAVADGRLDDITPHAAGWYAGGDIWSSIYGSPLRLADEARRLDTSPAWFAWVGAAESIEWLASLDPVAVHAHDVGLAEAFLRDLGLPSQGSAIVTIDQPDAAALLAAAGVRTATRAGRVRASFHVCNTAEDVARAVEALRRPPSISATIRQL